MMEHSVMRRDAGIHQAMAMQQLVNFNGDEKGGFTYGQPDGPVGAKGQTETAAQVRASLSVPS